MDGKEDPKFHAQRKGLAQYVECGPACTHIVFTYGTYSPQILPPTSPISNGNVSTPTFPPPVDMEKKVCGDAVA